MSQKSVMQLTISRTKIKGTLNLGFSLTKYWLVCQCALPCLRERVRPRSAVPSFSAAFRPMFPLPGDSGKDRNPPFTDEAGRSVAVVLFWLCLDGS